MLVTERLSDGSFVYAVLYQAQCDDVTMRFDTRSAEDAEELQKAILKYVICSSIVQ